MSAELVDTFEAPPAPPAPRVRRQRAAKQVPSTSIRVSVATRDALAREASRTGLSLTGYLDKMANRLWQELALSELREERIAAFQDQAFVAEMREWDDADDGTSFDDDGWPEFND